MKYFSGKTRRAVAPLVVSAMVSAVAACGSWFNWFAALDQAWYDVSIRLHTLAYPDDIAIVAIDESSLDRLGAWPWDRRYHALMLDKLEQADTVVFDLIFAEPQSLAVKSLAKPYADSVQRSSDAAAVAAHNKQPLAISINRPADLVFAEAVAQHGRVVLPVYIEQQQYRGVMQEVLPIPELATSAAALGHAHVEYASDGIARGIYLRMGLGKPYWSHLSLAVAQLLGELTPQQLQAYEAVQPQASPYTIYSEHFNKIRFIGAARSVYRFSYIDVLDGLVPADQLRGKRVYVGATAAGLGDDVPTPLGAMPGVEFHANAFHALRSAGYIGEISPLVSACFHAMLAFFACVLLSRLAPAYFLAGSAFALLAWSALVTVLFFAHSTWVEPTPFLVALLIFYPLWSWRRIEIALRFLRSELQQLQRLSPPSAAPSGSAVASMRAQLAGLVRLGVLDTGELTELTGSDTRPVWPDFVIDGATIRSTFEFEGRRYRVDLGAAAVNEQQLLSDDSAEPQPGQTALPAQPKRQPQLAVNTLRCLMYELAPAPEVAETDSYELVERTIDEIYAARSIVERTRERMNQSMARLQDTVVVADIAGKIIFINDVGDKYFEPGLTGATIFSLQDHLARAVWLAMLRDVMLLDKPIYQEVETVEGKLLLCQAAKLHEQDAARDTLLFVFTDVTQLRALEQSKNEALAFLSHDMRSPLVSQLALIEKFRLSSPEQAQAQQMLLQKLVYFAERSLKYSEDFLQLSRAENLDQQAFQLVDMHGVIDGAYSQVTGLALKHEVPIEISRANEDCWMQGDAQLLERAVTNLLSNAIQHSPAGGKVILSLQASEQLQVSIADCGRGIEEAAIPHLFEPYFRARQKQASTATSPMPVKTDESELGARNYGLGLSFVHSVVERHGGRIDVRSKLGHGTTFTLFFRKTELD